MKILFFGTPDFAIPSLQKLYSNPRHTLEAVVSNKDKRRGRGSGTTPTPVKKKALELNLPVIEAGDDLKDPEFYNRLSEVEADLYVVVAFRILPEKLLQLPQRGAVNLHASLLPKYRGAAPIHWAIMNGETETGCTVFQLEPEVDTGDILKQRKTDIGPNETTGELYQRLKEMGADLLSKTVNELEDDEADPLSQDDQQASRAPKLSRADCRIDFNRPAPEVHNKIRGLSPVPTAWTSFNDKRLNMYRSHVGPDLKLSAGQFKSWNGELVAGCKEKTVILDEVQPEGSKRISGSDFLNGYQPEGIFR